MTAQWRPTAGLVRAGLAPLVLSLAAVLTGRPGLLVLAVPLLTFAVAAFLHRPAGTPRASGRPVHGSVREGAGTLVRITLADATDVEHAVVALAPGRHTVFRPATGVRGVFVADPAPSTRIDVPAALLRWGRHPVGAGLVGATSPWAGYRWGPVELPPRTVTALPAPGPFESAAPSPHPIGLVGTHPARRTGDGSEFAGIRPFQPGDRLRRLHWRVSLRTGELHVTSTHAEEDASVLLVLDALAEIGVSGGVHGTASSLDVAVRAAGAIAEHYLHRGDRVGLRVLGTTRRSTVPNGAGRRHLRRLLDTLAHVTPGSDRQVDMSRVPWGVRAGTVVIVLSPMLSDAAIAATVTLARRGLSVIVVDALPERPEEVPLGEDDERLRLAWRLRVLEREALLRRVQTAGVPVVAWRGPGTLDEVLRKLGRRSSLPTLVRR